MATELAQGYISLIPVMDGAKDAMVKQLMGPAATAGVSAGETLGAGMGTSMKSSMLKFLGPAAIAAGIVVAFKGLYTIGETFDDVADTIRTGTGAAGDALDSLVDSAKNVGKQVPAEWEDIGTTIADLNTRLGLSGTTLETVASQYLEAGRILGEDVDINKSTAAFSAFGIEGAEVEGAMDALFRTSQATGVGMNDLSSTIQTAAPATKQLGFTFEDTAALIGTLDKAGLDATKMTAAMSKGIVTLAKDGEAPADAFKRVVGEIEGFTAAGDDAAALDLAGKVFGTRGATQFVDALKSGKVNFEDLTGAMNASSDTILGVGEETQDFAETWKLVKNNAQVALEPLGSAVFSTLGDALKSAIPYFNTFAAWLTENQWVLGVVAGVIGVTLVAAFVAWTASIWASTIALLANPITWIVLGIAALIAIVVLLVANWDKVTAAFAAGWEWIKNAFASGVNTVKGWLSNVWEFIKKVWSYSPLGIIVSNWDKITAAFSTVVGKVKGFFQDAWDFIKKAWSYTPLGLITTNWDKIMKFFGDIPGKVRAIFDKVRDGIKNSFKTAFNWVADLWNKSLGKIEFEIPSWVPGVGGKGWSFPKMPMLADGGTAMRAGWSVVGEQGPELRYMPRGASVVPLDHPASTMAGVGDGGGVVRLHPDDIAAVVRGMLSGARLSAQGVTRSALFGDLFLNDSYQAHGGVVAH